MLAMSGRTTTYSFSPVDEFVIGTTFQSPLLVQRGRDRHTLLPGQSCVWDPEHLHRGSAPAAEWSAQLVIVPACELIDTLDDDVSLACRPGAITDGRSLRAVAALQRAVRSRDGLAIEVELASVVHAMFSQCSPRRPTGPRAADQRLLVAREMLVDRLAENVTLAERVVPHSVHIVDVKVDRPIGASEVSRPERSHLGELIGEHDGQVAEAQLNMDQPSVAERDAVAFPSVEGFRIPS